MAEFKIFTRAVANALDENGNIKETFVMIESENPRQLLTGLLDGDWTKKSEQELIDGTLDYVFKTVYVDRAMSESVQQVAIMDKKMKEFETFVNENMKIIKNVQENVRKTNEEMGVTQKSLLELVIQLSQSNAVDLSAFVGDEEYVE